jgi:hypothetical protein
MTTRDPEFFSTVLADLVSSAGANALVDGVLPSTFDSNTQINVILFGRNTIRMVLPVNALRPLLLSQTAGYCANLSTETPSRVASQAGKFTVTGGPDGPPPSNHTVFGFPYELYTGAGPVSVASFSVAPKQKPSSISPRFDEASGKSTAPIILFAADFAGVTRFSVGDVNYEVVGVWDVYAETGY